MSDILDDIKDCAETIVTANNGLLTSKEVCKLLGIHRMTLAAWNKRGKLMPLRFTERCLRWRKADIFKAMQEGLEA